MQAWEKTYSPSQIKNLASYIKSLRGTNPANAKAPQGEAYTEAATADSTATISNESVTLNK
jgi:cytochrome c oxidase cbb3-type subunit 3